MATVGDRLKEFRTQKGITQFKFSKNAKIAPNYISSLENNKVEPTEKAIKKICHAYGLSDSWLLSGTGKMYVNSDEQPENNSNNENKVPRKYNKKTSSKSEHKNDEKKEKLSSIEVNNVEDLTTPSDKIFDDTIQNTEIIVNDFNDSLTSMLYKNIVMNKYSQIIDTALVPNEYKERYLSWLAELLETIEKISFVEKSTYRFSNGAKTEKNKLYENYIKEFESRLIK